MARIKGATMTHKRRAKTLKLAKGYYGAKSKHFRMAKQAVMKSGNYAFVGRKQKKRQCAVYSLLGITDPLYQIIFLVNQRRHKFRRVNIAATHFQKVGTPFLNYFFR